MDVLTSEPVEVAELDPAESVESERSSIVAGMAFLSLAAGAIHFAFTPAHMEEAWVHGAFFVVLAWFQLLWAAWALARPSRRVWFVGLLNTLAIAAWIVSRTVGAPFGTGPRAAEPVGLPDVTSTVAEALIVLGCVALLLRGSSMVWRGGVRLSVPVVGAGLLAFGAATLGLTPRYASEHHHILAAGHTHGAVVAGSATGKSPCEKSGPAASPAQITDTEGHLHRGSVPQVQLDQATQAALDAQQVQALSVVAKYPTVAAAEAAGYRMSTPYVPCIGAHYTNVMLVPKFDPAAPSELLYDGTKPDSKIVGLSYLVLHPGGAPAGFAGSNDHWHQHNANGGLCINRAGVVVGSEGMSAAQCTSLGGRKTLLTDVWMVHDWVVPGWACSWGVFAAECPELGGRIGGTAWDTPDPNASKNGAIPAA